MSQPDKRSMSYGRQRLLMEEPNELYVLQKQLNDQKQYINELVNTFKTTQSTNRVRHEYREKKPAADLINMKLLDEIKSIKRQVQQIENGPLPYPPPPQMINPYLQYQMMAQQQMMQYQHQQMPFYYPTVPNIPMYQQQPQYTQQPNDDVINLQKQLIQLIRSNETKQTQRHRTRRDRYRPQEDDLTPVSTNVHRYTDTKSRRRHRDRQIDIQDQQLLQTHQKTKTIQQTDINQAKSQKTLITPQRKKELIRKLKGVFWYVRTVKTMWSWYMKVWKKRKLDFYEEAIKNTQIFDKEFLSDELVVSIVLEANKQKLFIKDWVCTVPNDKAAPEKAKFAIQLCQLILEKLPVLTNKLSEAHKQSIAKISKNDGYLLQIHPKFVVDRLQEKPNLTLGPITTQQTKMIQMDYIYNAILLPKLLQIDRWYSQYQKIPKYKEAIKIMVSILHQLYLDQFSALPTFKNNIAYNTVEVTLCDFSQQEYSKVVRAIDDKDPKFIVTTNISIIGLLTKQEINVVQTHPTYSVLEKLFQDYSQSIYQLIG